MAQRPVPLGGGTNRFLHRREGLIGWMKLALSVEVSPPPYPSPSEEEGTKTARGWKYGGSRAKPPGCLKLLERSFPGREGASCSSLER